MFDISGKHVFITGGTAGIGLTAAKHFVEAGAKVVITGRRDAQDIADSIGATFIRVDVTDETALEKAFEQAVALNGNLDCLINNAGYGGEPKTMEESPGADMQFMLDINVVAVYNCIRFATRAMNDGGSIVNVASSAAKIGVPTYTRYGPSKAAVVNLTQNAAIEFAPRNIRVNAVCPGAVWSEMVTNDESEFEAKSFAILSPLGRVGNPEEIASIFHFLCSNGASFITGQAIYADGGHAAGVSQQLLGHLMS